MKFENFTKLVLLCLIAWISKCSGQEKAICRMSYLDSKLKEPTKMSSEVIWPRSTREIHEKCKALPKDFSEVRKYIKNCAKGESKTILSVSVMDKMSIKLYCKGRNVNSERTKIINAAKCANNGRKPAVKCWTRMIAQMTAVGNLTNSKEKIPLLCCSMMGWKDCFIKTYEDIGGPVCTTDHIEYMDQFLYRSMIDHLNIFCSEYDDSDKCNKFSEFLAKSSPKVKYNTPFPAIISIFESL